MKNNRKACLQFDLHKLKKNKKVTKEAYKKMIIHDYSPDYRYALLVLKLLAER